MIVGTVPFSKESLCPFPYSLDPTKMVSWDVTISRGEEQIPFACVSFLYLVGAAILTLRWIWRVVKVRSEACRSSVVLLMCIAIYLWLRGAFLAVVAIQQSCRLAYLQLPFVLYVINKAILIRLWSSFLSVVSRRRNIELDISVLLLVISSLILLGLAIASFADGEMLAVSEYVNLAACSITGIGLLRLAWLLQHLYEGTNVMMCSLLSVESRAVFATTIFGFYTICRSILIVLIMMGKENMISGLSSGTVNDNQWWWTPLFYFAEFVTVALCVAMLLETPEDAAHRPVHETESHTQGRLLSPRGGKHKNINSSTPSSFS